MSSHLSISERMRRVCFTDFKIEPIFTTVERPLKMTLAIKVVKIDSKIIISLPLSKSAKQTV